MTTQTNDEKGYNGWYNYLTWKVALNIDNDEGTYKESRRQIQYNHIRNGDDLKNWFCEIAQTSEEGFYKIFDGFSETEISEVDFEEIYEAYKKEVEGEDERGEDEE